MKESELPPQSSKLSIPFSSAHSYPASCPESAVTLYPDVFLNICRNIKVSDSLSNFGLLSISRAKLFCATVKLLVSSENLLSSLSWSCLLLFRKKYDEITDAH